MSTLPADAVSAAARFVLLRDLPLLVVDLVPPDDRAVGADADGADDGAAGGLAQRPGLFRTLLERGMVQLPRFYGVQLPRGVRLGLTLERDRIRLEDDAETTLLRVPRGGVDRAWTDRALALRGTMLCVGPSLGVGPDDDPQVLCDRLDAAAATGRVAGAIVGVAEPKVGLPLLFG